MALIQGKQYPEHLYYDLDNQVWYEPLGVVPIVFATLLGPIGGLRVLTLTNPSTSHPVGIQTLARKPMAPLAGALLAVLKDLPAIAGKPKSRGL